VVNHTT